MYIIAGKLTAKAESRDELLNMTKELIVKSLEEAGCISYGFYEDQSAENNFLFFEEWENRDAIGQHFEKSYFKDFISRFSQMIDGNAVIKIYEVANLEEV